MIERIVWNARSIAVVALVCSVVSALAGWKVATWRFEAGQKAEVEAQLEKERQAEATRKELQAKVDSLSADLETARTARKAKDRIITKEVIRYAQIVPDERRCVLDGTWRVLHDAAATGEPAWSTRVADGGAKPVEDAAALETVSENYADCREWREQVVGWQQWWQRVKPH